MQNFDRTLKTAREQKESGGMEPEIVDRRNTLPLDRLTQVMCGCGAESVGCHHSGLTSLYVCIS